MKLIVGLGNPGTEYATSRHNIGFLVAQSLAKTKAVKFKRGFGTRSLTAVIKLDSQKIILALPLTFMNLSGLAVRALLRKYKIPLEDLLVVADDLDLDFGRMKIKKSGSSAGHKGLASIIEALGTQDFARLKVGIGRPHPAKGAAEYVLDNFSKKESLQLKEILATVVECCQVWAACGIEKSMNLFNPSQKSSGS